MMNRSFFSGMVEGNLTYLPRNEYKIVFTLVDQKSTRVPVSASDDMAQFIVQNVNEGDMILVEAEYQHFMMQDGQVHFFEIKKIELVNRSTNTYQNADPVQPVLQNTGGIDLSGLVKGATA